MSKRRYRSIDFQQVDWSAVRSGVEGRRVVFGVDVAKHDFMGAVMVSEREAQWTIRWRHPQETRAVVERLSELGAVDVVVEPSGTYGDGFCGQDRQAGLTVYRVAPKRIHDAAEVYDGVPSLHDAKAAWLIGRLHFQGVSREWEALSEERRELKALLSRLGLYKGRHQRGRNRLEAQLSRHWPESLEVLGLDSVSLLELLAAYGDGAAVSADPAGARELLRRHGRALLSAEKIEALVSGAGQTVGVGCVESERALLRCLSADVLNSRRQVHRLEQAIQARVGHEESLKRLGQVIGAVSAAVVVASQGDPRSYPDADSLVKSCGLNLKERSSGSHKGQLKLTKRGPGVVRFYLYFAALRLLDHDAHVQRWYQRKSARPGALKGKCVVALMRKLTQALWHVARGERFDTTRLVHLEAVDT